MLSTGLVLDMFGSGQLVSTLLPAIFHSPTAQFFPAFPTRLGSQPQILIPGPFISYESLRSYLQPEPCKDALLLATQTVGLDQLTESIGEFRPGTVAIRGTMRYGDMLQIQTGNDLVLMLKTVTATI